MTDDLPKPDTHCFDDDTGKDVWSYSAAQMRAYAAAAVALERERCAKLCDVRAAYYESGDDDRPNARRASAAESCAAVIRGTT
jgi:hypothetical protein